MTEFADYESLLAERFAQLTTADTGDWLDVRRRARRMRVRGAALLAAAVVAAALVTAPALGLHRIVVDWFEAEPAPGRTQLQFLQLGVGAPPGMDPSVVPNSARKVTELEHDGKVGVLWVAPTKRGGFCVSWTAFFGGGCVSDRASLPTHVVRYRDDVKPILLGLSVSGDPTDGGIVQSFNGSLLEPKTERLVASYADGEEAEVPVVWVTPPIDAGFYAYWIPKEHRRPGRQVTALTALDEADRILARQTFQLTPPQEVERPVRLPDGQTAFLPRKAIVERARKLIDFEAETGTRVTLWVIPTTDGGRCHVFNRGYGCPPPGSEAHPLGAALLGGGEPVLIGGEVSPEVAVYELRYQDGNVERVRPVEGFVLHEIPVSHYPRGNRLELVRALDRDGKEVARHAVFDGSGVYPCKKPVDIGHGVMACP
jgi:hypothetical protein